MLYEYFVYFDIQDIVAILVKRNRQSAAFCEPCLSARFAYGECIRNARHPPRETFPVRINAQWQPDGRRRRNREGTREHGLKKTADTKGIAKRLSRERKRILYCDVELDSWKERERERGICESSRVNSRVGASGRMPERIRGCFSFGGKGVSTIFSPFSFFLSAGYSFLLYSTILLAPSSSS